MHEGIGHDVAGGQERHGKRQDRRRQRPDEGDTEGLGERLQEGPGSPAGLRRQHHEAELAEAAEAIEKAGGGEIEAHQRVAGHSDEGGEGETREEAGTPGRAEAVGKASAQGGDLGRIDLGSNHRRLPRRWWRRRSVPRSIAITVRMIRTRIALTSA